MFIKATQGEIYIYILESIVIINLYQIKGNTYTLFQFIVIPKVASKGNIQFILQNELGTLYPKNLKIPTL